MTAELERTNGRKEKRQVWFPRGRSCEVCGKELTQRQKRACCPRHKQILHSGDLNPGWKGDEVTINGGHYRANRAFTAMPDLCEHCEAKPPIDRHHIDGNTANNTRGNIAFLCRLCHMKIDGRVAGPRAAPVTPEVLAETVKLYRSGLSSREVGEIVGVSDTAVIDRLKRAGVPRRTGQETRRMAA